MSVAQTLESRQIIDGKYALVREIGRGASGRVYEAEHLVVGKWVALKLLNREAFAHPAQRDRFLTEARAAARIAHANVSDIHDLGVTPDGVPYLVMELLRGETLASIVETRGALAPQYACELLLQVLAALSAAHAQGVLHSALKPENVMITHPRPDRPHVKVLGFGVARGSGGTPMFMSPEQARGEAFDARSDIYSASALLYAMLVGRDPFEGKTPAALLQRVVAGDFAPLGRGNPQIPKLLAAIVERGLALEPRRRIDSAEEYSELLYPFISATPHALAPSPARRVSNDPLPRVAAQHEIKIQETLTPDGPPRESSVIPIRIPSYARGVSDSLLVAPRIPPQANSPRLEVGKDFLPAPGEPGWTEIEARRASKQAAPIIRPGRNAWPALMATAIGFSLGVVIAWLSGAL